MQYILYAVVAAVVGLIVLINHGVITENGKCPKCHRKLALREGPYGQFWGCTGYPNCTYTRKVAKS